MYVTSEKPVVELKMNHKMRLTPIPSPLFRVAGEIASNGTLHDSELPNQRHREVSSQGSKSDLSPVSHQLPASQTQLFNICKPTCIFNIARGSGTGRKTRQG